jgi:hypothetical protein
MMIARALVEPTAAGAKNSLVEIMNKNAMKKTHKKEKKKNKDRKRSIEKKV